MGCLSQDYKKMVASTLSHPLSSNPCSGGSWLLCCKQPHGEATCPVTEACHSHMSKLGSRRPHPDQSILQMRPQPQPIASLQPPEGPGARDAHMSHTPRENVRQRVCAAVSFRVLCCAAIDNDYSGLICTVPHTAQLPQGVT